MNTILAFDLYGKPVGDDDLIFQKLRLLPTHFEFPYLNELDRTVDPSRCRIRCLTYKPGLDVDISNLRYGLSCQALDIIGGGNISPLEKDLEWYQKGLDETRLRNFLNPFAHKRSHLNPQILFLYLVPFLGLIFDYLRGFAHGPLVTTTISAVSIMEAVKVRSHLRSDYKNKIENIQKKLHDPNIIFYSNLSEGVNKIEVDTVFVRDAGEFMNKIRELESLFENNEKIIGNVNERLRGLYQEFLQLERSL